MGTASRLARIVIVGSHEHELDPEHTTGLVTGLERLEFEAGSRSRRPSSCATVSGGGIMAIGRKPDRSKPMESLASTVRGQGPEVMLIHGGMTDGELAWGAQEPLAERWSLRVVDRAGYGSSAHLSSGEDIQLDARLVVAALDEPVHLVGHSSGAIVALLVAAASPRRVRSLTVVEPPSYRFVDDPAIAHLADRGDDLWNDVELSDGDWLLEFFDAYGEEPPSQELINLLQPHVPPFRRFVTRPWDIHLPVDMIKSAGVPCLVISGGHHPAFELLNDRIAEAIGARRTVVEGGGHEVQMTGTPFNEVIQDFFATLIDHR